MALTPHLFPGELPEQYRFRAAEAVRVEATLPLPKWPVTMAVTAFPVWFLLGLGGLMWIVSAAFMLALLIQRRGLVAPKGTLLYVLFLVAVAGSAFSLDSAGRSAVFVLRVGYYLSAGIFVLYCLNGGVGLTVWRIARSFTWLWIFSIIGGYTAFIFGDLSFLAPFGYVVPGALKQNELVSVMVNPGFADVQSIVGFPVPRPKAPYSFTNGWGSMMGLLTPFGLMAMEERRIGFERRLVQMALAASVIPAVFSLNRGMWLSIGLGLLYVTVRLSSRGNIKLLLRVLVVGAVAAAVVYFSPLWGLLEARLGGESPSDATRGGLISSAIEGTIERPFFGWGAPRPNPNPLHPPIGTHGQIWFLSFSHGIVGLVAYMGTLLSFLYWSAKQSVRVGTWAHAVILIGLIQSPVYLHFPNQAFVLFAAAAIALRLQRDPTGQAEILPVPKATEPSLANE